MEKKSRLIKTIAGKNGIRLSIFQNEIQTKNGEKLVNNIKISKSYKGKDNEWKETNTYNGIEEISIVQGLIFRAITFLSVKDEK